MTTPGTVTWLRELAERNGWELWTGCYTSTLFHATLAVDNEGRVGATFFADGYKTRASALRALARLVAKLGSAR